MLRNLLFVLIVSLAPAAVIAQDSPQGQQPTDFKGVTLKNKAPISNEVLKVKFPKPVESKLKNGMDLLVLEDHRSPTISVEIHMPGSTLNDPLELEGIGEATTSMMRLGTNTKNSKQIAELSADLGASVGVGAGDRDFTLRFSTLIENLDAVMELAMDILFNPSFPPDEIDKWKNQQLASLTQIRAQPSFLATERFAALMYPGDHRSFVVPSPDGVKKITRDGMVEYYKKNFQPDGGFVAVIGDTTPKQIAAKLDKALGNWKGLGAKPPTLPLPAAVAEKKIYLINRDNSVQTTFYVGNHAIDRMSPDYFAVTVMNRILGGGPSSRLFRNIREDKGYTYGISSGFSSSHYYNHFSAQTSVRTEVTGPAVEELLKEFRDIRDRLVPADELANAERALVASFALSTENSGTGLRNALTIRDYGFPADYWDTYSEKISAVTAEDVQRVARKYVPVDNLQIIAVGDASKIRDVLAKFGPIEEWDSEGRRIK